MTTISHYTLKLIKNLIFIIALTSPFSWGKEVFKMQNPKGNIITLDLALTANQHAQGLSGVRSRNFKNSQGMLFVNAEIGPRRFWMPDTYFNLDIIFLDATLKIVGIEKNVPAHPGNYEPPTIYKTNIYNAQFILETKAGSAFSKKLKTHDLLKFIGSSSLLEIALKTHRQQ